MNRKTCLAAAVLIFAVHFIAPAHTGVMSGEKNLLVTKTKWFDIIYPEECGKGAEILAENADRIYAEIGVSYGFAPQERMPVVITPAVENFNAYWTDSPYNTIVLYDTSAIEELSVFSETFLSTFRHELTHAYTYNMKNTFWRGIGRIFGDIFNPGQLLFITSGWAEGATLTSESSGGEGRLNDEFAMQMVKQAKIEDDFPSYSDVQGASDAYPAGSFYYFNGKFNAWLQENYGMEKYARFWYKCVNLQTISAGNAFRSVYGIPLGRAWKKFGESVSVPDVAPDPVRAGLAADFFSRGSETFSPRNNAGSVYSSLSVSEKGLSYIDGRTDALYFVPAEKAGDRKIRPKKLFTMSGIRQAAQSPDGRLIAVTYIAQNDATYRSRVRIYDRQRRRWSADGENSSWNGTIVCGDAGYYLVKTGYADQRYSASILRLAETDGKFTAERAAEVRFGKNETPMFITAAGADRFAFVKKTGLSYSVCIAATDGKILAEFRAPEDRMAIRYLSADPDGGKILFSWTKPGTMPRLGELDTESGEFLLAKNDISGGVYSPVTFGGQTVCAGEFFRQNRLILLPRQEMDRITPEAAPDKGGRENQDSDGAETPENAAESGKAMSAEKYNPAAYYRRGIFIPFSTATSNMYGFDAQTHSLPFGATYISSNPWNSGAVTATAGYGLETNSFAASLAWKDGTATSLFSYSLAATVEFDFKGWKSAGAGAEAGSAIPVGRNSYISFGAANSTFIGKPNRNPGLSENSTADELLDMYRPGYYMPSDRTNCFYTANSAGITFQSIVKSGPGRYEKAGFSVTQKIYHLFAEKLDGTGKIGLNDAELGLNLKIYIPKIIPINCINGLTYNLPTRLTANIFPISVAEANNGNLVLSLDNDAGILSLNAETVLFAAEIQKAVPFMTAVFVNNLRLSFVYNGYISGYDGGGWWRFTRIGEYAERLRDGSLGFTSEFRIKTLIGLTPNFGMLANSSMKMNFFTEWGLVRTAGTDALFPAATKIGIETTF